MLDGVQAHEARQQRGVTSLATGLALVGLGSRTALAGELSLFVLAACLILAGVALVRHELGRRGPALRLRAAPPEGVLLVEPGQPPVRLAWGQFAVFEPSILRTLTLLCVFLGMTGGLFRVLWELALEAFSSGLDVGRALVLVSVGGWVAALSGSAVVARTQWVEIRFPGRLGAAFISYRDLQRLGLLEGLKGAQ